MGAEDKDCANEELLRAQRLTRCAAADSASKEIEKNIQDTRKWLKKEEEELAYNISLAHDLFKMKERIESMAKSLEESLEITQESLFYIQQSRRGSEATKDAVEQSLVNEMNIMKENSQRLHNEISDLNVQLKNLFDTRHQLETDMEKKADAQNTEECVRLLCTLGMDVDLPTSQVPLTKSFSNSWIQTTRELIQKSQQERNSSQILKVKVNRVMVSCANQCFTVWYDTNFCLNGRLKELISAQESILEKYQKINFEIHVFTPKLNQVKEELEVKTPALKIAQMRVEKRTKKLDGLELCRDTTAMTLFREMHILKLDMNKLTLQQGEMEEIMKKYSKTRDALEKQLRLNDILIFTNRDKCLYLRQRFPIQSFRDFCHPKELRNTKNNSSCQFA